MTIQTKIKTVVEHLDEVRYAVDNTYIPSDFALKFIKVKSIV